MKEKDIYLKEMAKTQRGKMKKKLLKWGGTLDFCKRKQDEIGKLQKMARQFLQMGEGSPFLGKSSVMLKEAEAFYEKEIERMTESMKRELEEYTKLNSCIEQLEYEEQRFVKLRYEKGYQYEYIALQTHKSRAKCFRDHDIILDKLIVLWEENFFVPEEPKQS